MLYRVAVSPERLGWSPSIFWSATLAEFEMALEGLSGDIGQQPFISREEVRRIAVAHGKKRSLRDNPRVTVVGKASDVAP